LGDSREREGDEMRKRRGGGEADKKKGARKGREVEVQDIIGLMHFSFPVLAGLCNVCMYR